jgi:hypothetical protein
LHSAGLRIRPTTTIHRSWWLATRGRPKGWLGLGLAARSSEEMTHVSARVTRAPGALAAWSPHARRRSGALVAQSWLTDSNVLLASTSGILGWRQAGYGGTGATGSTRRRLGAATHDGVLVGEGVSSDVGEMWELPGGGERGEGGLNWGNRASEGVLTGEGRTVVVLG